MKANTHIFERLILAIISTTEDPKIICPAFEKQIYLENTPVAENGIHTWEEVENPFDLVANLCSNMGIDAGTIAISPLTPYTFFDRIHSALPKVWFQDGQEVLNAARIVKTDKEIELLSKASEYSARGIEVAIDKLQSGMTEIEASKLVATEMSKLSGEPAAFSLVQFGEGSANPHGSPTRRKLKTDDVVLVDAGTTYQGYCGDITNTTVFGTPTKKFLDVYSIVEAANKAGVNAGKSGNSPSAVDSVARAAIEDKGYGEYFTHRTGHGIGLDVHEAPYIVQTNSVPLALGNVYTIEPGIYLPGEFGIRIEDDVVAELQSGKRLSSPIRHYWDKR